MNLASRVSRLEASLPKQIEIEPGQPECFDWYGADCPCGLPVGDCLVHPRARVNQTPPGGNWRAWLLLMGRGAGKTRSGAEWVRWRAEENPQSRIALVAPTAGDARDVMVEGQSGILSISPPWFRPRYEPSKRRLVWPNGSIATTYSADEPERLRGPQHTDAWCDEMCAWRYPSAWDMLMFGLRLGSDPRVCITTTPKPSKLLRSLIDDPTTRIARGSTHQNRAHLAPTFFDKVIAKFEGTRLGQQELYAEILDISEAAWFSSFDPAKHVSPLAAYDPALPVHLAIDCGVSQHVGAVWFQARQIDVHRHRVTVFADMHVFGGFSEAAAKKIKAHSDSLPSRGRLDTVRLDPAANANTGVGPAAYGEFERVFGSRVTGRWPSHRVTDGLDQLTLLLETGCLLIHPACTTLKAAFQNYARKQNRVGDFLDEPVDPQHPHEDLMDAIRGGVRDRFPEGRIQQVNLHQMHASRVH